MKLLEDRTYVYSSSTTAMSSRRHLDVCVHIPRHRDSLVLALDASPAHFYTSPSTNPPTPYFRLACPALAWYNILHFLQRDAFITSTTFSRSRSHEIYHNVVRYRILLFPLRTDNTGYLRVYTDTTKRAHSSLIMVSLASAWRFVALL